MINIRPKTTWQYLLCCVAMLLTTSCATVRYQQDLSDYRDEIARLEARIAADPTDAEAQRDLGVIYFETANYDRADSYLKTAYTLSAQDAKTIFYYGINLEFLNRISEAMEVQGRFAEVSRLSPYRRLMHGRYLRLSRQLVQEEIRSLIGQEQQLDDSRVQPKTLAVFPLNYQGSDPRLAPLGRGLSEMLIVDLGQVRELKLLERIRLQTLLDELELVQSDVVDRQTAPRVGRLLGAGRILAGSFNVLPKNQLQVDMVSWDLVTQNFPDAVSHADDLENLFLLEKQLAFGVIDEMGIQLTPEERENIQRIPTRNLQAFFSYCRGLQEEDAGRFEAASGFFQNAAQIDPAFQAAATAAETSQNLGTAGGSSDEILSEIASVEGRTTGSGQQELMNSRLNKLAESIGSNFLPGADSRKSSEEATQSGADFGELATPPPPPPPPNQR